MAFKGADDVMEPIWDELPKNPDKDHSTFTEFDIAFLWDSGFVDSDEYSLKEWKAAFDQHKTAKNTYVLSKADFLEKDKYRYKGNIKFPFEPLLINEGKYTDEGLQELVDMSISPSCSKSRNELQDYFDKFKETYRDASDGLVVMDMEGKRKIMELINDNPSPTRRRELLFDVQYMQRVKEVRQGDLSVMESTPEQAAQVQATTFTTLPSSMSEKSATDLKTIEKRKGPKATGSGDEGIEVKKVKKSRKGHRG